MKHIYERIWTYDEINTDNWGIFNETSITGHLVQDKLGQKSAEFYSDLMNEVYNQVMKDIKENK